MKVLICGAGIAGLATAHRLAALGAEVVLLEKANGPRTQGYMIDFFGPGYDAAESMGLLPRLVDANSRVSEASYLDAAGRRRAGLDFAVFAASVRGRFFSIMRPDLERALREALPDKVAPRFGCAPAAVHNGPDAVRVELRDGSVLEADLLIGADGVHSAVREMVFGPELEYLRYLGFHTAAYVFADARVHAEVGDRFCLTDTVDRQLGFYGLPGGRVAVFAVHRTPDPALPADVRAEVRRQYGGLGWLVPRALESCPPVDEIYYDQVAQTEMPRWSRNRVVLVGDAAFAVSLLAGQGASMGIAGGYLLAEQVMRADTVASGLAAYERLWRPVMVEKQRVARTGARWFLPRSARDLRVRRAVMRLAKLPGMSKLIASTIAGKPTGLISELQHGGRSLSTSERPAP